MLGIKAKKKTESMLNTETQTQSEKKQKEKFFTTKRMSVIAVFTAMSYILYMFLKFPLPILFPSFLDFQFSDIPALIVGFIYGPFEACIVLFLKIALKLPFSSTLFVGELADLIVGLAFILPSSFIYRRKCTRKSAVIGLTAGVMCSTVVAIIANFAFLVPFYVNFFFKGNWNILLNMVRPLYNTVNQQNFYALYLPVSVLPFNLIRATLSAVMTYMLYKNIDKSFSFLFPKSKKETLENK